MARIRVGILDITAVVVVAIAVFLPPRASSVGSGLEHELLPKDLDLGAMRDEIAVLEGRLAMDRGDAVAAEGLTQRLIELGHHDQALRVAGHAASFESPNQWRAHVALSAVYAARIEIAPAFASAKNALEACNRPGTTCKSHQVAKLQIYVDQLDAGVKAEANGADPRKDPDAFKAEMAKVHPTVRLRSVQP